MTARMRVLGATAADTELGQALVREYVRYTCDETGIGLDEILPHVDDYHDYAATFGAPGCGFLVYETTGPPDGDGDGDGDAPRIAGSVGWRRIDEPRCSMNRLWVREPFRRAGIARALCLAVMDRAAADGYREMLLDVSVTRPTAIALYESLGFTETDPLHRYEFPMRYFSRSLVDDPQVTWSP